MNMRTYPRITTILKFGLAAFAMGTFFEASVSAKAGQLVWVRAQTVDHFRALGLVPPGSYSHQKSQEPATIAVNKSGQGVGGQKQTTPKLARKNTQNVPS